MIDDVVDYYYCLLRFEYVVPRDQYLGTTEYTGRRTRVARVQYSLYLYVRSCEVQWSVCLT